MSDVLVPPLGQTTDTVTLVRWYKQEGEQVTAGEPLYAIETDKAILDVEAPDTGVLQAVTASAGQAVHVLTSIAVIAAAGAGAAPRPAAAPVPAPEAKPTATAASSTLSPAARPGSAPVPQQGTGTRLFVSPRARRLAEQEHAPLEQIAPSGPEGAIVERDVRRYLASRPVAATTRAAAPMPRAAASAGAAPVTIMREVDAGALLDLCARLHEGGLDVTPAAVVLLTLARVLRETPALNATLRDDGIHVWREVHIDFQSLGDFGSLSFGSPSDGERTAIVRDAAAKSLAQIAREVQTPASEMAGGQPGATFSLYDLGAQGVDAATPPLAPGQVAALGMGRIAARSVVRGGQLQPGHTLWLSLTFDHRAVDGAPAARCLQRLTQLLETPHLLYAL